VPPKVLVVDDELLNRRLLTAVFEAEDFKVEAVESGQAALAAVAAAPPDVALLDLRMPGMGGLDTLRQLRAAAPQLPILMLTAHAQIPDAVEAIKLGAYDFLIRPINNDELVVSVRRALEREALVGQVHDLRRKLSAAGELERLMGPSEAVRRIIQQVEQVAASPLTVLLLGETGTGKEVVARAVHNQSERRGKPFLPVDCGAIPDTLIESELFGHEKGAFTGADRRKEGHLLVAEGGTLFLDEIGNLTPGTQAKLLRILQERRVQPLGGSRSIPVDVRVIAATNVALEQSVTEGHFRQDLFFRLAEFTLRLPPLRERREDVLPLALRFQEEASLELRRSVCGITPEAAELLIAQPWPGNVRELRNVIRQAVLQAEGLKLEEADIRRLIASSASAVRPAAAQGGGRGLGLSLKEVGDSATTEAEKRAIVEALQTAHGNKSEAARILRTDFKTLHVKMKRYGLQPARS
jgi:two-component system response regulator HydG